MDGTHGRSVTGTKDGSTLPNGFRLGTVAGLFHGSLGLGLWTFFEFESPGRMLWTEPLFLGYTLLGLFALGFVPGLLYARWGAISPGLLVGGSLSLSAYGTWTTVRDGLTPVDPTPFGWYVLFWAGIVVFVTVVGWGEVRIFQRGHGHSRWAK